MPALRIVKSEMCGTNPHIIFLSKKRPIVGLEVYLRSSLEGRSRSYVFVGSMDFKDAPIYAFVATDEELSVYTRDRAELTREHLFALRDMLFTLGLPKWLVQDKLNPLWEKAKVPHAWWGCTTCEYKTKKPAGEEFNFCPKCGVSSA
jgi:hypothetical protein